MSGLLTLEIDAKQLHPIGINVGIDSKKAMQTMIRFLLALSFSMMQYCCGDEWRH